MISHRLNADGAPVVGWDTAQPEEDDATRWRRRIQQRRCLACGSPDVANRKTSYFCAACRPHYRWCYDCQTLRPAEAGRREPRCRACTAARSLANYYANVDRNIYRIRLQEIGRRRATRADQIFAAVRARIALADLVARTPGLSWEARGRLAGRDASTLARTYRAQCAGEARDIDVADAARRRVTGDRHARP